MRNAGSSASIAELVSRLRETRKDTWQYLEVKQMGEILSRHREKMRAAMRDYRQLRTALKAEADAVEKLYLGYEGMFARDHLRDTFRLYRLVARDYHDAFDAYMAEIAAPAEIIVPLPAELLPQKKSGPNRRNAA